MNEIVLLKSVSLVSFSFGFHLALYCTCLRNSNSSKRNKNQAQSYLLRDNFDSEVFFLLSRLIWFELFSLVFGMRVMDAFYLKVSRLGQLATCKAIRSAFTKPKIGLIQKEERHRAVKWTANKIALDFFKILRDFHLQCKREKNYRHIAWESTICNRPSCNGRWVMCDVRCAYYVAIIKLYDIRAS